MSELVSSGVQAQLTGMIAWLHRMLKAPRKEAEERRKVTMLEAAQIWDCPLQV